MTKGELLNLIVTLESLHADIKNCESFVGDNEGVETDYLIAITDVGALLSSLLEGKAFKLVRGRMQTC